MSTPTLEPGGALPPLGALYSETLKDLTDNFGPYALATLGFLAVAFPVGMVIGMLGLFGMNATLLVGMLGAAGLSEAIADPGARGLVSFLGILGSASAAMLVFFGILVVAATAVAPISASLSRAIAAHQRGEAPLAFNSAFSTVGQDPLRSVGVMLLTTSANLLGLLFCYVGAIVPSMLFGFATLMVALHRKRPLEALSRAARHAMAHPAEHLLFTVAMFVTALVGSQIPLLGHAFILALFVRAYRKMFGDGVEPAV